MNKMVRTIQYNLKIILLAAGKSERFNGIKLLSKVTCTAEKSTENNSLTLIEHVFQQLEMALNELTQELPSTYNFKVNKNTLSVATGVYHDKISEYVSAHYNLKPCNNSHLGLGHTIADSVTQIIKEDNHTTHIMVALADQVALSSVNYKNLIKQSLRAPRQLICASANQELMPPAIFPQQYFKDLSKLTGDKGAKALLSSNKNNLLSLSLPNAEIDIDTQEDLTLWLNTKPFRAC